MQTSNTLRTQYKVSDFVAWQREGVLKLNPDFQRRPVWKKGAKSYLIDTIIRGLPMPIIFLRDVKTDLKTFKSNRDVVDGQQRIRTILSFIDSKLLKDFEATRDEFRISSVHNKELGGRTFGDLSAEDQQRILDYQFSVHTFSSDTDDRQILQIFARMNSTGVKLNAQELRNADFYGEFKTLAYELATEQLNRWRAWRIFSADQIARMNEVELTSEFMILMLSGILEKDNKVIDRFYEVFDQKFANKEEIAKRFRATFESISGLMPEAEISKHFGNRTMFFALFGVVYGIHYGILQAPKRRTAEEFKALKILPRSKATSLPVTLAGKLQKAANAIAEETAPAEVLKASRGATTDASQRRAIIGFLAGKDNDPCRHLS